MAFGSEYKSGSGAFFMAPIAIASENPLDPRAVVENYSDLTLLNTWAIQGNDTKNLGFNTAYHGMVVAVKAPSDKFGLYQLKKSSDTSEAKQDLQDAANWVKISVSDEEVQAILSRISALETTVGDSTSGLVKTVSEKLDKAFDGDGYSAGSMTETTTFAAREDNANVYITGAQIKNFAAAAVSDKGVFATEDALKAAYPDPEDGWSATVTATGTTWTASNGEWTDTGTSAGVTSVNGKSGNVTLVAADISDVYSKTETDTEIANAIIVDTYTGLTTDNKTVQGAINELDAQVATNTTNIGNNTASIGTINSNIAALQSTVSTKQDASISVTIGEEEKTSIPEALEALDTLVGSANTEIESKANADATNIDAAVWKTKLGYQDATDVSNAVTAGITTDTFSGLNTTDKTVQGAINEIKSAEGTTAGKVSTLEGKVTNLETTVGDSSSGLVKSVADNTAAIETKAAKDASNITPSTWRTKLDVSSNTELASTYQKQTLEITSFGEGATVESALSTLKSGVSANDSDIAALQTTVGDASSGLVKSVADNASAIATKVDKTTTVNGKALSSNVELTGADINVSTSDATKVSDKFASVDSSISTINGSISDINEGITEINGTLANKANAADVVAKSQIEQDLTSNSTTNVPSVAAVKSAVEEIKTTASKAYHYKGSDTWTNISAKTGMVEGDVWNSTTANGNYPAGTNYAWNGSAWDALGGEVDLSAYQTKELSTSIENQTTVEGALSAISTLANSNKQSIDSTITPAIEALQTGKVDKTTTVNGKALSGNISLTASDIEFVSGTTVEQKVSSLDENKAEKNASNLTTENVASWKAKLGFITASEVPEQVQSDWAATEGKGQILNKPDVETSDGKVVIGATSKKVEIAGSNVEGYSVNASATLELTAKPMTITCSCAATGYKGVFEIDSANEVILEECLTTANGKPEVSMADGSVVIVNSASGVLTVKVEY